MAFAFYPLPKKDRIGFKANVFAWAKCFGCIGWILLLLSSLAFNSNTNFVFFGPEQFRFVFAGAMSCGVACMALILTGIGFLLKERKALKGAMKKGTFIDA